MELIKELHRVWVKFINLMYQDTLTNKQELMLNSIKHSFMHRPIDEAFEKIVDAIIWYNSIKD